MNNLKRIINKWSIISNESQCMQGQQGHSEVGSCVSVDLRFHLVRSSQLSGSILFSFPAIYPVFLDSPGFKAREEGLSLSLYRRSKFFLMSEDGDRSCVLYRTARRSQVFVPYRDLRPQKRPSVLSSLRLLSQRVIRGGSCSSLYLLITHSLFCLNHPIAT